MLCLLAVKIGSAGGNTRLLAIAQIIRKAIPLLACAACFIATACRDAATTWSTEAISPDGLWIATAHTDQWGGPGTAYDATTVDLRPAHSSQAPTRIALFSHEHAKIKLELRWTGPTRLEVAYGPSEKPKDHVSLDFYVARLNGINVSVHSLSEEPAKPLNDPQGQPASRVPSP